MQAPIPPHIQRKYAVFGPFSMFDLFVLIAAAGLDYLLIREPVPWAARIPVIFLLSAAALGVALGRWPLDDTGDPAGTWFFRWLSYLQKPKRRVYR